MPPPLVCDAIALAWRCRHRLRCCRDWDVPVAPEELATLRASTAAGWEVPELAGDAPRATLPRRDDGACALLEGHLCGHRVRFGAATQPRVCRTFPYLAVRTPSRDLVGLDFTCPTALGLLERQAAVSGERRAGEEAPTDHFHALDRLDMPAWDRDGRPRSVPAFWRDHWQLFEAYQAGAGSPEARVLALAGGRAAVPPLPPGWDGALSAQLMQDLLTAGADPFRAAGLLAPPPPPADLGPLPEDLDADAILDRYLAHRLLVPAFLRYGLHGGRLLAMALALAVRWRVERLRGAHPLEAVRNADAFFFHQQGARRLFGVGPHGADWRAPWVLLSALTA